MRLPLVRSNRPATWLRFQLENRSDDDAGYERAKSRLETEMKGNQASLEKATIRPGSQRISAELYIGAGLYLKYPKNLERFYRKLEDNRLKDTADPQERLKRVYDAVSGGSAKQYLLAHCPRL